MAEGGRTGSVFFFAPIISTIPAFVAFSVIPFGADGVALFGVSGTPLQLTDARRRPRRAGLSAMGVYGIVLARPGVRVDLLPCSAACDPRADDLVRDRDGPGPSCPCSSTPARSPPRRSSPPRRRNQGTSSASSSPRLVRAPAGLLRHLLIAAVGETNRAPFDLPEAESELVGGFHTEYSSLKFALFFLAEYINMVTVSALAATLFLGGWRAPWPISIWDGANTGWWPMLWFFLKVVVALFVFVWLRGTLPRLRYDQFMRFGWKVLVPAKLVWILVVATMRTVSREMDLSTGEVALYVGVPIAARGPGRTAGRQPGWPTGTPTSCAEEASAGAVHVIDPRTRGAAAGRPPPASTRAPPNRAEGGFPIPPMDLKVPPPSPRLRRQPVSADGAVVRAQAGGARQL